MTLAATKEELRRQMRARLAVQSAGGGAGQQCRHLGAIVRAG